ncbi:hypothetical protein NUACC26_067080 [Scytonema sp. NUACC26]
MNEDYYRVELAAGITAFVRVDPGKFTIARVSQLW